MVKVGDTLFIGQAGGVIEKEEGDKIVLVAEWKAGDIYDMIWSNKCNYLLGCAQGLLEVRNSKPTPTHLDGEAIRCLAALSNKQFILGSLKWLLIYDIGTRTTIKTIG